MSALLEEVKELARETAEADQELRSQLWDQASRPAPLAVLEAALLEAPGRLIALYKITYLIARGVETADQAASSWKELRVFFAGSLKDWEKLQWPDSFGKQLDNLVRHHRNLLAGLVEKADAEYRAYKETAFLLRSPENARRLALAIEETRSGKLPIFANPEEAKQSLRSA
jgi:hypothetical protein